jgi:hypothetical protein
MLRGIDAVEGLRVVGYVSVHYKITSSGSGFGPCFLVSRTKIHVIALLSQKHARRTPPLKSISGWQDIKGRLVINDLVGV